MKNSFFLFSMLFLSFFLVSCSRFEEEIAIVEGVSQEIASFRKKNIDEILYDISFKIPEEKSKPIMGELQLEFNLKNTAHALILDFNVKAENVLRVAKGNSQEQIRDYTYKQGHILIPPRYLQMGKNYFSISFIAGETSLNRNKEFLYTLFVPDRASTAFPCFDQPDMKAKYALSLEIPTTWTAVANGKLHKKEELAASKRLTFEQTKPLSTYLFSFVAGKFKKIVKEKNNRRIAFYHRETDSLKIQRNVEAVFDMIYNSLDWLEEYTQIKYPFAKYDLIAIPSFQYGGMEHTGATLYRASKLFLDESATQKDYLYRANLIAHETSHMWFGDYVTMKWFDDVWLKEVFANFMADKIVRPDFPELNHDLMFAMAHFPASYAVDRTKGSNPIQQKLDNLKDAGSLYGAIIYHKSPIVMYMLEQVIGEEVLKQGIREYMKAYAYANAGWDNLIEILDKISPQNLAEWSRVWVKEPEMPIIKTNMKIENDIIENFEIQQFDPSEKGRIWNQIIQVELGYEDSVVSTTAHLKDSVIRITEFNKLKKPKYVLTNADAMAYGRFLPVENAESQLSDIVYSMPNPLQRGVILMTLWEEFLNNKISLPRFFNILNKAIEAEENDLNLNLMITYYSTIFRQFIAENEQAKYTEKAENLLWSKMESLSSATQKSLLFKCYCSVAQTPEAIEKLYRIWSKNTKIKGLTLSENDFIRLSYLLAVHNYENCESILDEQIQRLTNQDKIDKMKFVRKAVSPEEKERNSFFESLKKKENRRPEDWVLDALYYYYHPLRREHSLNSIAQSLEMLEEIKYTGDIFFPRNWLDRTFRSHNSTKACNIVSEFLNTHLNYPSDLRSKILQSTDLMFRANKMLNEKK